MKFSYITNKSKRKQRYAAAPIITGVTCTASIEINKILKKKLVKFFIVTCISILTIIPAGAWIAFSLFDPKTAVVLTFILSLFAIFVMPFRVAKMTGERSIFPDVHELRSRDESTFLLIQKKIDPFPETSGQAYGYLLCLGPLFVIPAFELLNLSINNLSEFLIFFLVAVIFPFGYFSTIKMFRFLLENCNFYKYFIFLYIIVFIAVPSFVMYSEYFRNYSEIGTALIMVGWFAFMIVHMLYPSTERIYWLALKSAGLKTRNNQLKKENGDAVSY